MSSKVDGHHENTISVYMTDTGDYEEITVNFTPTEEQEENYLNSKKTLSEMSSKEFEREMQHRASWIAENLATLLSNGLINDITGSDRLENTDDLERAFEEGVISPTAAYR